MNGTRGFVDPRYRKRSALEARLLEIMDMCWEHDGHSRVDIFTVVEALRELAGRNGTTFRMPVSDSESESESDDSD